MDATPIPIAGTPTTTDATVDVTNPFTQEVIAAMPLCGPEEVDRACRHAAAVLAEGSFPQHERAAVLDRAAVLLAERTEDLARTIATEAGKPIRTARVEVARAVDTFRFAAAEARHLSGEVIPLEASSSGAGKVGFALRVPAGVVAAISPFNFPLNLVAHKVAPAIAAGCPVVLKPAPQTPLTSVALVQLLVDAGMPKGWISIVTDSRAEAGGPLVEHPVPAVVTFTGSVPVGWGIAASAPRKRVLLELGSNSPLIVMPDTDVEDLARRLAPASFGFAGQSCISVQRILAHQDIHGALVEALAEATDALVVGDPLDEATDVGPLIAPGEIDRVKSWIDAAAEAGGRVVAGGRLEDGLLRPTVVDGVDVSCDLWRKEVFGPAVGVRSVASFDEAVTLANDSDFGLHVGVFTKDIGLAMRAARELDFGGILVNEVPTWRADQQPYGGVRDAGNTREGPAYTVEEMTTLRFVTLQG